MAEPSYAKFPARWQMPQCPMLHEQQDRLRKGVLTAWAPIDKRADLVVDWMFYVAGLVTTYEGASRVYFIEAPANRLIKIGRSADPQARLTRLRLMSPVPLEIRGMLPGDAKLEAALHSHFDELKSHGEWFFAAARLSSFIDVMCREILVLANEEYRQ